MRTRLAAALLLATSIAGAQQPTGSVALGDLVQGLGVNTRVLVIGAHPDDEDTYLISWLARGRHVETAYLSLTRGEGGQNLIGNELGYALGQIRTEELLAARRIDGGRQFFTRAVDFGFSKSYAETSERWPKPLILKDVVAIIRRFRPHVIVSVWTGTDADGHGHHQYAGVIAKDAFEAAADSAYLTGDDGPWATPKLYRVARVAGGFSTTPNVAEQPGNVKFNVGEYDPALGRSYAEIATLSRSEHRSQGQGRVLPLGALWDGLTLDTSRVGSSRATDTALFDGIDTSWSRFRPGDAKRARVDSMLVAIQRLRGRIDLAHPDAMVPTLAEITRLADDAGAAGCRMRRRVDCNGDKDFGLAITTTYERASQALLLASGVTVEAYAAREKVALRDSVDVTVALYNRGNRRVTLGAGQIVVDTARVEVIADSLGVAPDSTLLLGGRVEVPSVTYPWWLVYGADREYAIYNLEDAPGGRRGRLPREMLSGEDRLRWAGFDGVVAIEGVRVPISTGPIVYRYADPAFGEKRHPMVGVPRITSVFQSSVEYIRANTPVDRGIRVEVSSAWSRPDTVNVQLGLPTGLRTDSLVRRVVLPAFGKVSVFFRVRGSVKQDAYKVFARVVNRTGFFQQGFIDVLYDHINPVRYYQPPEIYLSAVDVKIPAGLQVAYVRGVGDNVLKMLEQLDVKVKSVAAEALPTLDPAAYSTLVIGPRAFEANEVAAAAIPFIHEFARRGGTVVTQYQQTAAQPGVLPFPVTLSRPADRVTDEKAAVTFVAPNHPLLNSPNRITAADFKDWGQERGLYMPRTFDAQWKAPLEMHDPDEPPNYGGLLVAPLGKGMYVYTTLSFFRQLPGGSPGAARLFVNLLSAGLRTGPTP